MASTVTIRVRAANATAAGFNSVRNSVRSLSRNMRDHFRNAGADAGNFFVQALNGSIGGALRSAASNPIVGGAILALAASIASLLGAALAGALVLAFGGAFTGIGIALAAQSKKVQKDWGKTLGRLKTQFTDAAKGMLPVLSHANTLLGKMGDKFAPHFKKAMEKAAPHMNEFLTNLTEGIEEFGKEAWEPMMDAFNDLLDAFGPELKEWLGDFGKAFKRLAETVSENKEAVAQAMHIMLMLINGAINVVTYLTNEWARLLSWIENVKNALKAAWGWLSKMGSKTWHYGQVGLETIVKWAKAAWNWIQKIAGKVWHYGQVGLETVVKWAKTAWRWITRIAGKVWRFGQRGFETIVRWAKSAWRWITRISGKIWRFGQRGLQTVVRWAKSAVNWISRIKSKTIHIGASVSGWIKKFFAKGGVVGFAKGGNVGSVGKAATGGVRSNMTMVGEQGPELVDLPVGSRVKSNPDTRRMLGKSGGGNGGPAIIEIKSSGNRIDDMILEILREAVRVRGGNVQLVVGGKRV